MKQLLLILLLAPVLSSAQTLPVNWKVVGTFTDPTIVILQDANNLVIRIGANQKAVAKTAFTKLTGPTVYVHDTVRIVLDPKQSADYVALAKQFVDAMAERDYERTQKEQALSDLDQAAAQYAEAVRTMKTLNARLKKDTVIWIRLSPDQLIKIPVRIP